MESNLKQEVLDLYLNHFNSPVSEWDYLEASAVNADYADKSISSSRNWRKLNPNTPTAFTLKMEQTFPHIEPEALFDLTSDYEKRIKWDSKIIDAKILEKNEDGSIMLHYYSPKPPIPIISQRELLTKLWRIKDYKDGVYISVGCSVEHPDYPIGTGMFAYVRGHATVQGFMIEKNPNGTGSKFTEIRQFDLGGSIPGAVINKISGMLPVDVHKHLL